MAEEQKRAFKLGDIHVLDTITGQIEMIDAHDDVFIVVSQPPSGKHRITNMYWDEGLQVVVVEKDSVPAK